MASARLTPERRTVPGVLERNMTPQRSHWSKGKRYKCSAESSWKGGAGSRWGKKRQGDLVTESMEAWGGCEGKLQGDGPCQGCSEISKRSLAASQSDRFSLDRFPPHLLPCCCCLSSAPRHSSLLSQHFLEFSSLTGQTAHHPKAVSPHTK